MQRILMQALRYDDVHVCIHVCGCVYVCICVYIVCVYDSVCVTWDVMV